MKRKEMGKRKKPKNAEEKVDADGEMSKAGRGALETVEKMAASLSEPATMRRLVSSCRTDCGNVLACYLSSAAAFEDTLRHFMNHIGEMFPFAVQLEALLDKLVGAYPKRKEFAKAKTLLMGACHEIFFQVELKVNAMLLSLPSPGRASNSLAQSHEKMKSDVDEGDRLLMFGLESVYGEKTK